MKLEIKLAEPSRAEILFFISGRAGLGPKFQFPFRTGPGSDLNFNFSFESDRTRPGPNFFSLLRVGPGLKNSAGAQL